MHRLKTILVIEDDPNDQLFIVEAFRSIGAENPIHVVRSASEAVAYCTGKGIYANRAIYAYPTFGTTDLKMAGGNGFAVLEHLKENPQNAAILMIVLSASDDPDDINRSYLLGAKSYHHKPVSFLELKHQIEALYRYWMTCKVPVADEAGKLIDSHTQGKLSGQIKPHRPAKQKRKKR